MSTLLCRLDLHDPSRAAILDERGVASWGELLDASRRVAASLLRGRGSLDGGRVGVFASPSRAFAASLLGILHAGGCVVVLSPLHPEAESRWFCEDAGVTEILVSDDLASRARAFAGGRAVRSIDALLATPPIAGSRAVATGDALMLYTSGTTGKPKGAVIAHDNITSQAEILGRSWGFSATDVLLHALPLHHMHGLCIAFMTALGAGAATRLLPAWDAARVWTEMADATVFMGVPTMYAKLFSALDAADDASRARYRAGARKLRLAASGSAALPVSLAERWREVTGAIPLERFGMTEIGVGLTNPLEPSSRRPGCVGFPPPSVEARIVGEDGRDADVGELWIRGPSVFRGYHGRPDATREAFADGGWFRTGDTVTRDDTGSYRVLGRTSVDILKSGGYKLSSLEIEEVLREHPAVAEVAVVGVPDAVWGDRVVACVVARGALDGDALRAFAKEKLASYKCPKEVVVMGELPRNAMGKVQKPALVATLRARSS